MRIHVPVLAFFSLPRNLEKQVQHYNPETPDEREAMEQKYLLDVAIVKRHSGDLQKGVPAARVIEMPNATFYIFLSNEAELVSEMRSFLASIAAGAVAHTK